MVKASKKKIKNMHELDDFDHVQDGDRGQCRISVIDGVFIAGRRMKIREGFVRKCYSYGKSSKPYALSWLLIWQAHSIRKIG